ncbi:protein NPAT [Tachyglossus aculeatus]|uniref:protein NPAT n=1 Tax=Tachyglossus aculeatus TaxID=9261 RepID=UPI0018F30758|nr:protein NPAT [Tachyglossus aculeatus]
MLLPSDVARLVLGYLQQENLISTCQAFILESSDLKEYAEHCTDEGFIPACLLSLFGKNLTTILNEYVAMKAKETTNEVPAMMSSLWKKLDYTLSQIRSMQTSAGFAANQRARTRSGIAEIKRQRKIASQAASSSSESLPIAPQGVPHASSHLATTQVIRQSTQTAPQLRQSFVFVNHSQDSSISTGESLQIVVPGPQDRKINASLLSPGRRKSESQRKSIVLSGPHSTIRNFQDSNTFTVEKQMVIENAREKILSNKSLQEKLAENINKFLISDGSITQAPKQTDNSPTEQEASIDEILGFQSEIHMSEEAIRDILEHTESDPAFQDLYDLFDYGKTKNNKTLSPGPGSSILLADETAIVVEGSFETEETGNHSGEPRFCPEYQPGEASCALKNGSSDDRLRPGTQGQPVPLDSSIQKEEAFKAASSCLSALDQRCGLSITFDPVPPLNDSTQRPDSGPEYNEPCVELFGNQMAVESEKASSPPGAPDVPGLQSDASGPPSVPLVLPGGGIANDGNATDVRLRALRLSQNGLLTEKPSRNGSPGDAARLETTFPGSKSPTVNEIERDQMETLSVLSAAPAQRAGCPNGSSERGEALPVSVESTLLAIPGQRKIELELRESATSEEQPSSGASSGLPRAVENATLSPGSPSSEKAIMESQEALASVQEAGAGFLSPGESGGGCREIEGMPAAEKPSESTGEPNPDSQSGGGVSCRDGSEVVDPSSIVSLKIIISDDPFVSADTELNNAVSSISGENLPTIILSSPSKSPAVPHPEAAEGPAPGGAPGAAVVAEGENPASVERSLVGLKPQDSTGGNAQDEEGGLLAAAVPPGASKDGGFIQLMPPTGAAFARSSNILIATCVTDPSALGTAAAQSNVVVLPGGSAPLASQPPPPQPLQTPPRSGGVYAMNQAVSPNFSQGSAIIIASPVQPVLQGMVGMIPVSVVGQSGNTFPAPPRQVLHMPIAAPLCNRSVPKLPLPPKSQKNQGGRHKPNTVPGKLTSVLGDSSSRPPGFRAQRSGISDKSWGAEPGRKAEDGTVPPPPDGPAPAAKQNQSHRRVLCFDGAGTAPGGSPPGPRGRAPSQSRERSEGPPGPPDPPAAAPGRAPPGNAGRKEREKPLAPKAAPKADSAGARGAAGKEAQPEKKASLAGLPPDSFHKTTANKENELRRDVERPKNQEAPKLSNGQQTGGPRGEKAAAGGPEPAKKPGPPAGGKNAGSAHPPSKPAGEAPRDGQWPSPVGGRPGENGELPGPRTPGEKPADEAADGGRTPSGRRGPGEESGGGTPKVMIPPATPDLPACSPASETGSENSVNMAAHTLMILSRAAIARTGGTTPLKDNTQQFRSSRGTAKKRKLEDLEERERNSRPPGKNLQSSTTPVKKKKMKKKKLPNSFPAGMDVDKFLLSLHYDE